MALREDECFLVRRVADRGIDIGGSHAHGDRFSCDRRSADRGKGIRNRDPWDFEIKRLKQRVRDLDASSTWKETEPEELVRDESTGDEEHPTNGDTSCVSLQVYDEYEDEEWYFRATGEFATRESLSGHVHGKTMLTVVDDNITVDTGDGPINSNDRDASNGVRQILEFQTISTKLKEVMTISLVNMDNSITHETNIGVFDINAFVFKKITICDDGALNGNGGTREHGGDIKSKVNLLNGILSRCDGNMVYAGSDLSRGLLEPEFVCRSRSNSCKCYGRSEMVILQAVLNNDKVVRGVSYEDGFQGGRNGTREHPQSYYKNKTSRKQGIPFDPGGFGFEIKLEDEFFSKTESMMQKHLEV